MSEISVDGVETWVPLDLDGDAATVARGLVERFGDDDTTATIAAGLGGVAVRLGQDDDPDGPAPLGAWIRTLDADDLTPLEVAVLRVLPFDGAGPGELAEELVDGVQLHSAVELGDLETASGPATTVRFRSVRSAGEDREVHEDNAVAWLRSELRCAVVLSAHSTDLVSAVTLPGALHQLATGVRGL